MTVELEYFDFPCWVAFQRGTMTCRPGSLADERQDLQSSIVAQELET